MEDFKETGDETFAWESFEKKLSAYSFLKYLIQENDIHVDLPGLKTFLSFSETDTEKLFNWSFRWDSRFKSHSFENVEYSSQKVSDWDKASVSSCCWDRKSYDHLIKLKSEYGGSLSWVLPYPGDWHILFFNLIFY